MILIVEGADLVGKSTLIDRFRQAHPWPVAKIRWARVGDDKAETIGVATATVELLRIAARDVILDRCYFSRWAYGEERSYLPDLISGFDRVSGVVPSRLVLLTATDDEVRCRYDLSPDHYHSIETIVRANQRYPSLLPLLPASLPSLHIDTTSTNPDECVELVHQFIAG
jgi:thymidylate kinase